MELSSSDQELMTEINTALVRFINSDDTHLQLEPRIRIVEEWYIKSEMNIN